jgi:hypothetical protein
MLAQHGSSAGERLVGARCVARRVNAQRRSGWAGPIRMNFFVLFLFPFSVNFEILGEIKKCSDYFEKLFRLKLV